MKTRITCVLFIIIFISCGSAGERSGLARDAEPRENDCARFGIEGRVCTWTRSSYGYAYDSGKSDRVLLKKERFVFDERCMVVRAEGFDEYGNIVSSTVKTYTDRGALLSESNYDGKGGLLAGTVYRYGVTGEPVSEITDDRTGGVVYVSEWKRDRNLLVFERKMYRKDGGHVPVTREETVYENDVRTSVRRIEYRSDGSIGGSRIVSYMPDGKVKRLEEYDGNGTLVESADRSYDDYGNLVKLVEIRTDHETGGQLSFESVYVYDSRGRLVESREPQSRKVVEYDDAGNETSSETYDESGNPSEKIALTYGANGFVTTERRVAYAPGGIVAYSIVSEFDEDGRISSWTRYDASGTRVYGHKTLYDSAGNKIEEVADATRNLPRILYRYEYDDYRNLAETNCYRMEAGDELVLAMSYEYGIEYRK